MKKFNFIIIDDEISGSSYEGWGRVVSFLYLYFFLLDGIEDIQDFGQSNFNYKIFSKESEKTSNTFNDAVLHIKHQHNSYDFFFFDIDLANKDDSFFSPEDMKTFFGYGSDGKNKSIHLAGLEFINILEKDMRPKIFFSGSGEVKDILKYYRLIENRLDDVLFGDLALGDEYAKQISNFLDSYIKKRQIEACLGLGVDLVENVKILLKEGDFDKPCIPSIDKKDYWSLRTLFPRQCNKITRLYKKNLKHEGVIALILEIENIITNYPKLLQTLCTFAHEERRSKDAEKEKLGETENRQPRMTEKKISLIKFLNEKEYRKDSFKKGVSFKSVSDFLNISSTTEIASFKNKLVNEEWSFKKSWFANIQQISKLIEEWILEYGFYPGYLDYIIDIIRNNAIKMDQSVQIVDYLEQKIGNSELLQFTISILIKSKTQEITHENLKEALRKSEATKNDLCFCGITSEGMQDILKIICFRYNGSFEFIIRNYMLRFKNVTGKISGNIISDSSLLPVKIDNQFEGVFRIILPQLKKDLI